MVSSEGSVFALVRFRVAAGKSHHILTWMTVAPRVCVKTDGAFAGGAEVCAAAPAPGVGQGVTISLQKSATSDRDLPGANSNGVG